MNSSFQYLSPLLLILVTLYAKRFIRIIFMFLLFKFSSPFSTTSWNRIFFYANIHSPECHRCTSRKKLVWKFLILIKFEQSKIVYIIGSKRFSPTTSLQIPFFQNLILHTYTKEQIQNNYLFLRNFSGHNYQPLWHNNLQALVLIFPLNFPMILSHLLLLQTTINTFIFRMSLTSQLPFFKISTTISYISESIELTPSVRHYAKHTLQPPSIDTNFDISLQTMHSNSNVSISIPAIGNPRHYLDPQPPPPAPLF